jgi:RND family efflux transporter MFP subunit
MKKISIIFLTLMFLTGCQNSNLEKEVYEGEKTFLNVFEVEEKVYEEFLYLDGYIVTKEDLLPSFEVSGTISGVNFLKGDQVRAGDVLAILDKSNLEIEKVSASSDSVSAYKNYLNAKEQYELYKENFENIKSLYESKSISKYEYDQSKLAMDSGKNSMDSAYSQYVKANSYNNYIKDNEEKYILKANQDMEILNVLKNPGDVIGPGVPIYSAKGMEKNIVAYVNELDFSTLNLDTNAKIEFSDESIINSKIVRKISSPDPYTKKYPVYFSVPNGYFDGQHAIIKILINSKKGILIQSSLIDSQTDGDYVYVLENNTIVKKIVKIIDYVENQVFIEGIKSGEILVDSNNKDASGQIIIKED